MYPRASDGMSAEVGAGRGYRREFEEMENRIRKCERQRAELERQFAELMRERAESERAAAKAMKQRYRRQVELDRQRRERNESILMMLNKIDQQAASLAAKTDRLKMLKTQYEIYLMRTYSTAQSYSTYNPPMITAPPTMLQKPLLPPSPTKANFSQYLSELAQQPAASMELQIPPPTALSNYLASQPPKPPSLQQTSYAVLPAERPYSRMGERSAALWDTDGVQRRPGTAGSANALQMPAVVNKGATKATRFEMSNEDFIRYIDSEVLKEPLPTVSVVAPSPEGNGAKEPNTGAYLEDVIMSEDEQRPAAVADELAQKVEEFSITVKEDVTKDEKKQLNSAPLEESFGQDPVATDYTTKQPLLEEVSDGSHDYQSKEPDFYAHVDAVSSDVADQPPTNQFSSEVLATGEHAGDNYEPNAQYQYDISQEEVSTRDPAEPISGFNHLKERVEHNEGYGLAEQQDTAYHQQQQQQQQQPIVYNVEDHGTAEAHEGTLYQVPGELEPPVTVATTDHQQVDSREDTALPDQSYENQAYVVEHDSAVSVGDEGQQLTQPPGEHAPMQQPTVGSQRWSTARQAMRAKAFPGMPQAMKQPIREQVTEEPQETSYEISGTGSSSDERRDPEPATAGTGEPTGNLEQNVPYTEYPSEGNEQGYYNPDGTDTTGTEQQQQGYAGVEGYPDAAMGQPVDYQTSQPDDSQQAAMYQYQQVDGQQAAYQAGPYGEGGAAEQYQYAEGVDQNAYAAQEGYHDPNQQYQYDENAQYYDHQQQQQQQQGYEQGQYYSEDTQQQQQYYMEDTNQQQQGSDQQEQLAPDPSMAPYNPEQSADNQNAGYYPPQTQFESPMQNAAPATLAPDQPLPPSEEATSDASKPISSQGGPSIDASPAADPSPEKQSTDGKEQAKDSQPSQANKKGAEPESETPTVSTVNDESDFDFSTQ